MASVSVGGGEKEGDGQQSGRSGSEGGHGCRGRCRGNGGGRCAGHSGGGEVVCSRDGMEVLGFIGKVVSLSAESGRAGAVESGDRRMQCEILLAMSIRIYPIHPRKRGR